MLTQKKIIKTYCKLFTLALLKAHSLGKYLVVMVRNANLDSNYHKKWRIKSLLNKKIQKIKSSFLEKSYYCNRKTSINIHSVASLGVDSYFPNKHRVSNGSCSILASACIMIMQPLIIN